MDDAKRKAIEAAGWKAGDAADFLEMERSRSAAATTNAGSWTRLDLAQAAF